MNPESAPSPLPLHCLPHPPPSSTEQGQDSRAGVQMLSTEPGTVFPSSQPAVRGRGFGLMRRLRSLTPHLRLCLPGPPLSGLLSSDKAASGRSLRRTWLSAGAATQLMPVRPWDYCFPDSSRHRYLWLCFKMLSGHLFRKMLKAPLSCILNSSCAGGAGAGAALCWRSRQFYIYIKS